MKYFFYLLFLIFASCKTTNSFYHGIVTDENNNPLENVIVLELYRENQTKTDENGYFNFERYSSTFLGDLIFVKDGYKTDTIPTVWHQAGETTEYNFVENDTTIVRLKISKKKDKLDLTIIQPKSENRKIPKSWKSLGSIQQNWIKVEKDEEGYLIYEPCDGETPTIKLSKGNLHIKPQIEPETIFTINKFTQTKNNTGLMMDVYPKNNEEIPSVYAEIIDQKNGLVIWKIGGEKLIMTPIENAVNFRKIKNNCPDYKRGELKFIEQNKNAE